MHHLTRTVFPVGNQRYFDAALTLKFALYQRDIIFKYRACLKHFTHCHFCIAVFGKHQNTGGGHIQTDRKSTRLNSSHVKISYAVFCLKKKTTKSTRTTSC